MLEYACMYTKQKTQKNKVWHEGIVVMKEHSGFWKMTLYDTEKTSSRVLVENYQYRLQHSVEDLNGFVIYFMIFTYQ